VRNEAGDVTHYIGNQVDVTGRVNRERRTTYLAYHDELTALPNRTHVLEHLQLELQRARRSGMSLATVMVDLNGFKAINDRFGHSAGDAVLTGAAQRLRSALRSGDLLGRFGGDEFLVVLAGLPPTEAAPTPADDSSAAEKTVDRVRQHLQSALDAPVELPGATVRLSASFGWALFPRDATNPTDLIARADAAMYRDKPGS
jgi:diguanylate cyclase (GGDEF)-like protein